MMCRAESTRANNYDTKIFTKRTNRTHASYKYLSISTIAGFAAENALQ